MFVLELSFDNDPRRLEARPAHRQRLSALNGDGRLVYAGPWTDDSGALLVFDTDEAGARQIVNDDPYYTAPGVTVLSLRECSPLTFE